MMPVVDASVAAKWFLDEEGSDAAREVLSRGEELCAPELLLAEVASAHWKAVRKGAMTPWQAREARAALPAAVRRLMALSVLAPAALDLALRRDHPVYDCFYVALAGREGVPLLTADRRLAGRLGDDAEIRLIG